VLGGLPIAKVETEIGIPVNFDNFDILFHQKSKLILIRMQIEIPTKLISVETLFSTLCHSTHSRKNQPIRTKGRKCLFIYSSEN
jgi:hypothetical protein